MRLQVARSLVLSIILLSQFVAPSMPNRKVQQRKRRCCSFDLVTCSDDAACNQSVQNCGICNGEWITKRTKIARRTVVPTSTPILPLNIAADGGCCSWDYGNCKLTRHRSPRVCHRFLRLSFPNERRWYRCVVQRVCLELRSVWRVLHLS